MQILCARRCARVSTRKLWQPGSGVWSLETQKPKTDCKYVPRARWSVETEPDRGQGHPETQGP